MGPANPVGGPLSLHILSFFQNNFWSISFIEQEHKLKESEERGEIFNSIVRTGTGAHDAEAGSMFRVHVQQHHPQKQVCPTFLDLQALFLEKVQY